MNSDHKTLDNARQYCPTLTLRKVTEEGARLVDVREPSEIAALAFDVPGVIVMPLSELEQRFAELPRDQELILACAVGERSLKATYFLMYHGYDRVANMEYGLQKWVRKGFPVKGDASLAAAAVSGGCCCAGAATDTPETSASCCTPSPSSDACC